MQPNICIHNRLGAILMLTPYTYYIKYKEINYVYRTIYTHRIYIVMRKCVVMSEVFIHGLWLFKSFFRLSLLDFVHILPSMELNKILFDACDIMVDQTF